jgi:hypothetical protein
MGDFTALTVLVFAMLPVLPCLRRLRGDRCLIRDAGAVHGLASAAAVAARHALSICLGIAWSDSALAYVQLTVTNGGNAGLGTRNYDVFVENDPQYTASRAEVPAAPQKWRAGLAKHQITLMLRDGNPPQTPIARRLGLQPPAHHQLVRELGRVVAAD